MARNYPEQQDRISNHARQGLHVRQRGLFVTPRKSQIDPLGIWMHRLSKQSGQITTQATQETGFPRALIACDGDEAGGECVDRGHGETQKQGREKAASNLLHKLRLQLHRPKTINLAINIVVAINQANALHLGAHLHHPLLGCGCGCLVSPLMRTLGADEYPRVFVGEFGVAF